MIDTNIGFNTCLNNFKSDMVNTINDSGLPVGIVYYIMKDLFIDIENAYKQTLINEKEIKQEIKEEEKSKK